MDRISPADRLRNAWRADDTNVVLGLNAEVPFTMTELMEDFPDRVEILNWMLNKDELEHLHAIQLLLCATYSAGGHLVDLQSLHARHNLTGEMVRIRENLAFRVACTNGHLATARWLVETFHLSHDDGFAASEQSTVLITRSRGHIATADWLQNLCAAL